MERKTLRFGKGFHVAIRHRRAEAAQMVLEPGDSEGDSKNLHRGADQWLYVREGTGRARINGRTISLRKDVLLLIEKGDTHEIKATGKRPLKTLNWYVPPAYTKGGNPLPRARRYRTNKTK